MEFTLLGNLCMFNVCSMNSFLYLFFRWNKGLCMIVPFFTNINILYTYVLRVYIFFFLEKKLHNLH